MSDLAHTMVVCGLISGTQPFTLLGMFLVLAGDRGSRAVWWYLFGAFSVQFVIVLALGLLVGGTVDEGSTPGRSLVGLRIAAGLALVVLGLWLRRRPATEPPAMPKVFDRLNDLSAGGAFVAGIAIADYQGSMLAAAALATADVARSTQVGAWVLYALFATGIPVAATVAVIRSARAKGDLQRALDWVMRNRRALGSWICLVGGLALAADGLVTLATTG
ncbi:MAG: GAP family protein [Acidimicrobiales bacterium]|nr:GAP family protein [Actinomycetota bacterium]